MKNKYDVLQMVLNERKRQDEKWGYPQENTPFEWISILGEEFGKLSMSVNDAYIGRFQTHDTERIQKYAIQLAAVAVALVEHLPEWEEEK